MAGAGKAGNGGAYVWVWALLGLIVGLVVGLVTGLPVSTTILGLLIGWLAGLSLKDTGTGADAH